MTDGRGRGRGRGLHLFERADKAGWTTDKTTLHVHLQKGGKQHVRMYKLSVLIVIDNNPCD